MAICYQSGQFSERINSVVIGCQAAQVTQGNNSIAIRFQAGQTSQPSISISFSAGSSSLIRITQNACYLQPIRNVITHSNTEIFKAC